MFVPSSRYTGVAYAGPALTFSAFAAFVVLLQLLSLPWLAAIVGCVGALAVSEQLYSVFRRLRHGSGVVLGAMAATWMSVLLLFLRAV